jgi:hypothetical protein
MMHPLKKHLGLTLALFLATGTACTSTPEPSVTMPNVGHAWSLSVDSGVWVQPENADDVLAYFPTDYPFFMSVNQVEGSSMDLVLALVAEEGKQDYCSRTVMMPGVTVDKAGRFQFGPIDFVIANGLTTENMEITGTVSADMKSLTDVAFSGDIVIPTIPDTMLELPDGVTLCEVLAELNLPCTPCRNGNPECLRVHKKGITANDPGAVLVEEVDAADCHGQCDVSQENVDCSLP